MYIYIDMYLLTGNLAAGTIVGMKVIEADDSGHFGDKSVGLTSNVVELALAYIFKPHCDAMSWVAVRCCT